VLGPCTLGQYGPFPGTSDTWQIASNLGPCYKDVSLLQLVHDYCSRTPKQKPALLSAWLPYLEAYS
jgi:hypothetical protein